ncbi:hypothetical protein GQ42DRAFT_51208 [Ramicandelaber brevisporus]|nr:hypothetical protein GQ42DRAFT_51208 [Ramicandelaber brevisporus]
MFFSSLAAEAELHNFLDVCVCVVGSVCSRIFSLPLGRTQARSHRIACTNYATTQPCNHATTRRLLRAAPSKLTAASSAGCRRLRRFCYVLLRKGGGKLCKINSPNFFLTGARTR